MMENNVCDCDVIVIVKRIQQMFCGLFGVSWTFGGAFGHLREKPSDISLGLRFCFVRSLKVCLPSKLFFATSPRSFSSIELA